MNNSIGQIIYKQMLTLDRNLVMCMGTQKLTVIKNGLSFKVNGLSFKGFVEITLNGKDLYDIKLIKQSRKANELAKSAGFIKYDTVREVKEEINDVYAEDMMQILEDRVEKRN